MNNYHFIRRTFTRCVSYILSVARVAISHCRNQLMLSVLEEVYPDVDGKYNELIGAQRAVYTKRYGTISVLCLLYWSP